MRARMDEGEGEQVHTRNETRRTEKDDRGAAGSRVVTQSEITRKRGGMRPRLPSVFSLFFLTRPGVWYLYADYNGYSTREVSEKGRKGNERLSRRQAARRRMEVGSGVEILLSCREGCDVEHKATGARNGTAVIDADL